MATFEDLDAIARSMPEVEVRLAKDDRPEYRVGSKAFLFWRNRRKDAVDEAGEPLDDVLVFRTLDLLAKDEWLGDRTLPLFTTPHFDGWPGVLLLARDLERLADDRLRSLVEQAWAAQAPKRLAAAWRARQRDEGSH
jgi:hypothetical protein